jgi:hypothetical protein
MLRISKYQGTKNFKMVFYNRQNILQYSANEQTSIKSKPHLLSTTEVAFDCRKNIFTSPQHYLTSTTYTSTNTSRTNVNVSSRSSQSPFKSDQASVASTYELRTSSHCPLILLDDHGLHLHSVIYQCLRADNNIFCDPNADMLWQCAVRSWNLLILVLDKTG